MSICSEPVWQPCYRRKGKASGVYLLVEAVRILIYIQQERLRFRIYEMWRDYNTSLIIAVVYVSTHNTPSGTHTHTHTSQTHTRAQVQAPWRHRTVCSMDTIFNHPVVFSAAEGEYTVMQTQTQTQGHTHTHTHMLTHLPPPVVHPLQTHRSLVHDVMLPDPSSAASPSFRLSHTPLSFSLSLSLSLLLLILLVAPACICWISSDSTLTTHTHTRTRTHTRTHTHSLSHTHTQTRVHTSTLPSLSLSLSLSLSHTHTLFTHTLPGGFLRHCSLSDRSTWLLSSSSSPSSSSSSSPAVVDAVGRWKHGESSSFFLSCDSRRLGFRVRQKDERTLGVLCVCFFFSFSSVERVADRTPGGIAATAAWEGRGSQPSLCSGVGGGFGVGGGVCSAATDTGHPGCRVPWQ